MFDFFVIQKMFMVENVGHFVPKNCANEYSLKFYFGLHVFVS